MKIKARLVFVLLVLAFCVTACGGGEAKRPVDYPNTEWTCEEAGISFTVSAKGKVENATALNKNEEKVAVTVVFSDISEKTVSFYSTDGKELYFSGSCTYSKDSFALSVSDIYNSDFFGIPPYVTFKSK